MTGLRWQEGKKNITAAMTRVIATALADRWRLIRLIVLVAILLYLAISIILGHVVTIVMAWSESLHRTLLLVLPFLIAVALLILAIGLAGILLAFRFALALFVTAILAIGV